MTGGNWYAVLEWEFPYEGVEITRSEGDGLRIKIPFTDRASAESALNWELMKRIEQENPVVQGSLVTGEIEAGHDNDK